MEYITFKQFFYSINIRNCYISSLTNKEVDDGFIIKLFYGKEYDKYDYMDISWYDYTRKADAWKTLEKYLKKEILESIVTGFYFDQDYGCLVVYACAKEDVEETLEEYND